VNKNDLKPINLNIFKNGVGFNIGKCRNAREIPLATTHYIAKYYGT